jgi:phage shock protein PspC (stress-responsive transcriptional regulator)
MPLYRSRKNRMFGGVCGGLAEWLGWDPTMVRIVYVLVSVLSAGFPGILVYLALWIVMPAEPLTAWATGPGTTGRTGS